MKPILRSYTRALAAAALACGASCSVQHLPLSTARPGPTSLKITLRSPTAYGSIAQPITDTKLVFDVQAMTDANTPDTSFDGTVNAYVFFEDTLNPSYPTGKPIATIQLQNGAAQGQTIDLAAAYGPTYGPTVLWIEDADPIKGTGSFATGTSPILYYANPLIPQVRKPLNPADPNYNIDPPLLGKEVTLTPQTPGSGALVVTAVFAQAFTMMDVANPAFGGIYVLVFAPPQVQVGTRIQQVTGAVALFTGTTEINFPIYHAMTDAMGNPLPPDPSLIPPPTVLTDAQFQDQIYMESQESRLVEMDNGKLCPLPPYDPNNPAQAWISWKKYGQWSIDVGYGCGAGAAVEIESSATLPNLDPTPPASYGANVEKVLGIAQNVAGISTSGTEYSFFLIIPRGPGDLQCDFQTCPGH